MTSPRHGYGLLCSLQTPNRPCANSFATILTRGSKSIGGAKHCGYGSRKSGAGRIDKFAKRDMGPRCLLLTRSWNGLHAVVASARTQRDVRYSPRHEQRPPDLIRQ